LAARNGFAGAACATRRAGRGGGIVGRPAPILMTVLAPGGYGISAMRGAGSGAGAVAGGAG